MTEVEELRAENARLKDQVGAAQSTLTSWFEIKGLAQKELVPEFIDMVKGYLRTSRNGGMPQEQSDIVENVLEDFAEKYLVLSMWPLLLRIAEEKRGELKVPISIPTREDMSDERLLKLIETVIDRDDHKNYSTLLYVQNELIQRIKNA